jgi:hypothetical protein
VPLPSPSPCATAGGGNRSTTDGEITPKNILMIAVPPASWQTTEIARQFVTSLAGALFHQGRGD